MPIYKIAIACLLVTLAACTKKQEVHDHYKADDSWASFVTKFGEPDSYEITYESEDGEKMSAKAIYKDFSNGKDLVVETLKKPGQSETVHMYGWRK